MKSLPLCIACLLPAVCLLSPLPLHAVEDEAAAEARAAAGIKGPTKGVEMQYGPVLSYSVELPGATSGGKSASPKTPAAGKALFSPRHLASKGLVVKLGEHDEGYVCYDTDTQRMAAAWTGGFLNLRLTNIGSYKGDKTGAAEVAGEVQFSTASGPGAVSGSDFADPRPEGAGPLPHVKARFKGFYLHGQQVILSYQVEGCDVLESASLAKSGSGPVFIRSFTVAPAEKPLSIRLADAMDGKALPGASLSLLAPSVGATIEAAEGKMLVLRLPPHRGLLHCSIALAGSGASLTPAQLKAVQPAPSDLTPLCHGGPARWPQAITLAGSVAPSTVAYVVDTIPVPEANPWKSWMRISAFDFFADGRAAVATLNGDVWIVSGLNAGLEKVVWKRFAVGLYEPLGLKIVHDVIYVHGRNQITRLHDLNGDGEADFYECFNSDRTLYPSYHAFAFDLQTDSHGNFYYVVGGNQLGSKRDWHAALFRVAPDGSKTETVATGFRAPNGMAIGPHDEIVVGDNQGHWIPSSKISLVKPGGFYGHVADPRIDPKAPAPPSYDQPLCWIPMTLDNSSGGEVWVTSGKWGPYEGHLLHTSYGKSSLMAVLEEKVDGVTQGGVVTFPVKFASGIMRARFDPQDGQLYVAGLRGWQSNASKDGCFQRVRYTGQALHLPTGLHVQKEALAISFDTPLDTAAANDEGNFSIEQYEYKWWSTYGSPDLSIAHPGQKGRDRVEVTGAKLSPDGKTVTLSVPGLRPVMQMEIKLHLRAGDGSEINTVIGNTIHRVP